MGAYAGNGNGGVIHGHKAKKVPSDVAKDGMNRSTDDTSHVFVRETGELWARSVWMDEVDWVDDQKRGWHWKPDPRTPKKGAA